MDLQQAINHLQDKATKNTKDVAIKRGVPTDSVIGVSTAEVRKLARQIGTNDELAVALWSSNFHEAKLLAMLIFSFEETDHASLSPWVENLFSWGVCDQLAKALATKIEDVSFAARSWIETEQLYVRRFGLALIANHCMKSKELSEQASENYCSLITYAATDDRQHVKQAACWALRELGKIDDSSHELAINLALELQESGDTSSAWVGRCAYKELETLIKIPERRRLISRNSKTAKKYL